MDREKGTKQMVNIANKYPAVPNIIYIYVSIDNMKQSTLDREQTVKTREQAREFLTRTVV